MKAIHTLIAIFFAATLGASAQLPAKRTMKKDKEKVEVPEGKEAVEAKEDAPVAPPTRAKGAPKATPAAPVTTAAEKKAAPTPPATAPAKGGAAGKATPAGRPGAANGRPGAANGRPGAATTGRPAGGTGTVARDFPTAASMPDDAAWRREIYRTLDLTKEENAVLYFPIMPTAQRQNLFCFLFRQILQKNIKAYKYDLDTNEHFDEEHIIKGRQIMDTHNIYYEVNDGKLRVNDADLPSEEVKLYYIKECVYYDQHNAAFRTKVTAICPVMVSSYNDFGEGDETRVPLFWINYEEAAPYLAKLSLMGSSMNNAVMVSADDFFTMGRYKGDIYKTTNLQDKILIQSADNEDAILAERKRIEGELGSFQAHVWGHEPERLIDVYGNPVLDEEGRGITYNEEGKLVDSRGRRIAFVVAGKDSLNVVSDNPELDPLPEIVFINERGFAVDEQGNPLLREDGSPIETTDEYPEPSALAGDKKKTSSRSSSTPTRRGSGSADTPTRRGSASSSSKGSSSAKSSSSKSSSSKSSASKSSSKPAKTKAPKSSSSKGSSSKSGGLSVRKERH